ncbi:hypothetical protein KUCAC02_010999 [Chaenocephalus aceratus]|uniref:Uncharacterized protein n=1 Tax=Chaenocephalus aceratus TaxID=36190 RepID=A0ACB9WVG3_CHAAC|nr:hypothetical protein KUCAC02_010999 [Chaenocephalus aceratus]
MSTSGTLIVTTSIPSFARERGALCAETPPVLGSSTPGIPPPSATTVSSGPALSRPNLRYSGHHGAMSRLISRQCFLYVPSPIRDHQGPVGADIHSRYQSWLLDLCPVPLPMAGITETHQRNQTGGSRGRELTARCPALTRRCCSLITPTEP